MRTESSSRLQELFAAALELPAERRDAFLDASCADDEALRAELRGLLAADARVAGTTARTIVSGLAGLLDPIAPAATLQGTRVGPYELRELLGQGGMGQVWRAERVDGAVEQTVAIKFVHRGLLDADLQRRFELERRVLASFDHPNIARLIDAAALPDGTPYYVMEYIDGIPITRYCEERRLDVRQRVELLRAVCGAVSEAHHKLVVHRDIKPNNVLVTRDGAPKLLDFGIAKLIGGVSDDRTVTSQRYFSPKYSAPEQLAGGDIGVACDVYALGLLLYELLAGQPPFDFAELTAGQIERLIREVPPEHPSRALAERDPRTARLLRGDLDDVVQRCLRKSPADRYASVERLEADLGHYIDGHPVSARGGHGWYRFGKFVRRNAVAVTAGALAAVGVLGGAGIALWQSHVAHLRADELQKVAGFQEEMLQQLSSETLGRKLSERVRHEVSASLERDAADPTTRQRALAEFESRWSKIDSADIAVGMFVDTVLAPSHVAIDAQFADQPQIAERLLDSLADQYSRLGRYADAAEAEKKVIRIRERLYGAKAPGTVEAMAGLGNYQSSGDHIEEAEATLRRAVAAGMEGPGAESRATLDAKANLAIVLEQKDDYAAAVELQRDVLAVERRILGESDHETIRTFHNLAYALRFAGQLIDAEAMARLAVARGTANPRIRAAQLHTFKTNLGVILKLQGRLTEAEAILREAYDQRRLAQGESHPEVVITAIHLSDVLFHSYRIDEARALVEHVMSAVSRGAVDEASQSASNLAMLRLRLVYCDLASGKSQFDESDLLAAYAELDRPDATLRLRQFDTVIAMAKAAMRRGRVQEATAYLERWEQAARKRVLPDSEYYLVGYLTTFAEARLAQGALDDADRLLEESRIVCDRSTHCQPGDRIAFQKIQSRILDARHRTMAIPGSAATVRADEPHSTGR